MEPSVNEQVFGAPRVGVATRAAAAHDCQAVY